MSYNKLFAKAVIHGYGEHTMINKDLIKAIPDKSKVKNGGIRFELWNGENFRCYLTPEDTRRLIGE